MHKRRLLLLSILFLGACNASASPTETPLPTRTSTEIPTATLTPTIPASETATITPTATFTASPTETPLPSETPTITATASITPFPEVGFVFDNWDVVTLQDNVKDGVANPMIAFTNSNDQQTIANIATAQPNTGIETLYLVSPSSPGTRIPIIDMDSSTGKRIFLSRPGTALSYVRLNDSSDANGLYILDLTSGFSARVMPGDNPLVQRGFFTEPDWSPDGEHMAMAVTTGYDIDIFLYNRDGSGRSNLTQHGSYDIWPRWSPNGRYLSFVSDRAVCPSWIPGDENACDALSDEAPTGGHVYTLEVGTGTITQVSDVWVTESPYWVNDSLIAFANGDTFDLLNPQRRIFLANIRTGTVKEARLQGENDSASYLSESWSPDGSTVLFQRADSDNEVILMTLDGQLIARDDELDFPRYSMTADWSTDGTRMVIGGTSGQCPYGVRVKESNYENVARGNPPPSMCDPQFSIDGEYIAFTGINPRVDGRVDVYVANFNGFGLNNLTVDLRGQVDFIGWVGGQP